MFRYLIIIFSLLLLIHYVHAQETTTPPYSGTIFIAPDIFLDSDPTAFEGMTYAGMGLRQMYDRRTNSFNQVNAHLFDATFKDRLTIEVQVNPEFSKEEAEAQALKFLPSIGQLPTALREDVRTIWLHDGNNPFGGGNNNLLIHAIQGDNYINSGILTETFFHEATHTSLDADYATTKTWTDAQAADGNFISTYARDFPTREDLAETLLMCFGYVHKPERLPDRMDEVLEATIPNRIQFFRDLNLNLYPAVGPETRVRDFLEFE